MKKLLSAIILLSAFTTYGQFTKGTRTVGINISSIGFSALNSTFYVEQIGTSSNSNNSLNLSITPSMGWFIKENVLVGGNMSVNFNNSKYTAGNNVERKGNSFTIGLGGFGRYYLGTTGFMPYLQATAGVSFGSGKNTWDESYPTYSEKGEANQKGIFNINAGLGAGLTKMVNKNVGIDLGIGYAYTNASYDYSYVTNIQYNNPSSSETRKSDYRYKGSNHGVNFSVGFLVFLDPKTKK